MRKLNGIIISDAMLKKTRHQNEGKNAYYYQF